jgi:hypothetical protein
MLEKSPKLILVMIMQVIRFLDVLLNFLGLGASWYLDSVEITNYATGEDVFFPCKMWFDKSKDDKKIERELIATEKTEEMKDEYIEEEEEAPKEEKSGLSGLKMSFGIGKVEKSFLTAFFLTFFRRKKRLLHQQLKLILPTKEEF